VVTVKHRALLAVTGSIGALALLVSLTIAAAGSASTADPSAAAIKAPPVVGAAAIKKKYGGTSITFLGDSANAGLSHLRDVNLVAQFSKQTGVNVKLVQKPENSTDGYAQLARAFSAHSSAYDVMMLDVVWPASFAPYLVNLKPALGQQAKLHQVGIVQGFTIGGKLVAMPWFSDYGILYYRTDLLKKYGYSKPPTTWAQLGAMAKKIQDGEQASNPNFYGFVYQGNAYEGLACDALEWLASSGGGHFIDGGKVTIDNPKAAAMLNLQRSWVGKITPRGVTTYTETESNNAFDSGNAAFLRNWPYGYSTGQASDIKGKFDVTVLPHSGKNPSVGTVGGWALGVSKYSKNIGAATEFVRYLTNPAVERYDAIYSSNVPTITAIARLPAVRKVNPWLKPAIATVARVSRPTSLGVKYQQGIKIIYQGINQILNGQDAKSVLPRMQSQLNRLVR
jgi:trehalose/maltose transport system substrate-binding protein